MTKPKLVLGLLLVIILSVALVTIAGCETYNSGKVTGGGSFINGSADQAAQVVVPSPGDKITFGFNAQPVNGGPAKGEFQLIDHTTNTNIHGTFDVAIDVVNPVFSDFSGSATINGEAGHSIEVTFYDSGMKGSNKGDGVLVSIDGAPTYDGILQGGNITIHK